jgi:hypothetical protein
VSCLALIQKFHIGCALQFFNWGWHKMARVKATITDPHLWIPLVVLAIGVTLLAVLA